MMMELLDDQAKEFPILIERINEDVESVIDRTYESVKQKHKLEESVNVLGKATKTFIENVVMKSMNSKTKRENYYEYELIKSYKEKILFLENQIPLSFCYN